MSIYLTFGYVFLHAQKGVIGRSWESPVKTEGPSPAEGARPNFSAGSLGKQPVCISLHSYDNIVEHVLGYLLVELN